MSARAIALPSFLRACPCMGNPGRYTHGFAWLLGALVAILLLYPMSEDGFVGALGYAILMSLTFIGAAIHSAWRTQDIWIAIVLVVIADVSLLGESPDATPLHHVVTSLAHLLFFVQVTRLALVRVLAGERITTDHLYGAACIYMMIAVTWTPLYLLILATDKAAFAGSALMVPNVTWREIMYFSFSSLTTLGFGDIVPMSNLARSATSLEAVTGNLFLAILIGRMAGLHVNTLAAQPRPTDGPDY